MEKEAFAPNAIISDTTEKTALSTDALTVASCGLDMMKTNASTTPNTLAQILSNKNPHPHPLSKYPHQKPLKNHASLPTDKAATPPLHQMESEKEDAKERNPNGKSSKTMLTGAFPDNFRKWMKNTNKSNMTIPPMTTSMANLATPKIFEFSMEFQI